MFCDQTLAARIEAAEVDLLLAAGAHVRRRVPEAVGLPIGGGLASLTEPGSPLNKVAGLGFAPFDAAAWPPILAEHARRGMPVQVELSTLADPALGAFFTERGHALVAVENVLGRRLTANDANTAPAPAAITISTVPPAELPRWLDIMITGFAAPDTQGPGVPEVFDRAVLERVIGDFAAAAGVVLFLAHHEGRIAGAAALRVQAGIAQLCGASTLPALRRRGVQSALLAHRLAYAARSCDLCVMTTQPGSKSMQNALRAGFALLYARNVLVRATGAPA